MEDILDIIDTQAEMKDTLNSVRRNFKILTDTGLRAGTYLLDFVKVNTAQTVTSASYVKLDQFNGSISTSGGIVSISGAIYLSISPGVGGGNGTVALFVDDQEVAWMQIGIGSATALNVTTPLLWASQLNAGNHTWALKAKISSATLFVGYESSTGAGSTLSITEAVKG